MVDSGESKAFLEGPGYSCQGLSLLESYSPEPRRKVTICSHGNIKPAGNEVVNEETEGQVNWGARTGIKVWSDGRMGRRPQGLGAEIGRRYGHRVGVVPLKK